MTGRRVVVGHVDGRSAIVSDEVVEPVRLSLTPGTTFHRMWGGDEPPSYPDDGTEPRYHSYFPPVNGYRYEIVTLPPEFGTEAMITKMGIPTPEQLQQAMHENQELLGMPPPELPAPGKKLGMHSSGTLDIIVVLSGELTMEVESGEVVVMGPGDSLVQNGTEHLWTNNGSEPVVFAVFLVGAHRADAS